MTAEEAISYIENYGWSTTRLGLERTEKLLEALGNPQRQLKFIHVAGSNGKGSACAMFDAILRKAGYKCGLYTSPYIEDFCERIRINGQNIPGDTLGRITEHVMGLAEQMEDHPSQFELVTAIAMQYYAEERCDIVILEVGMGGALDSTNAIDAPELACITNIGLEHTEYLGNTLEEIARTKAGIIKPGCSCVCYDGAPEVTAVVQNVCRSLSVPFTVVDFSRLTPVSETLDGQMFFWTSHMSGCGAADPLYPADVAGSDVCSAAAKHSSEKTVYRLSLIGQHQLHNAALVLTGIEVLRDKGWQISDEAVRQGLQTVEWPARLEVLNRVPLVLLDGGHNPQCAEALTRSLRSLLPGKKVTFLAGVLRDKDYETITDLMLPFAENFVCVTPLSDRALSGKEFADFLSAKGVHAVACGSIEEGIARALELGADKPQSDSDIPEKNRRPEGGQQIVGAAGLAAVKEGSAPSAGIVIFGSLYLAGAARKAFPTVYKKWLRKSKIKARDSLLPEQRKEKSERIVERILASDAFHKAKTIMIYNAVRGEVSLESLKKPAEQMGKILVYPYCVDKATMLALEPFGKDSFQPGAFGIPEPVPEKSRQVMPEELDLVLCPCTSFDEECHRLGMGGGYYDRFLPQCVNAQVAAVAFEAQRSGNLPTDPWDRPVQMVFTEDCSLYS